MLAERSYSDALEIVLERAAAMRGGVRRLKPVAMADARGRYLAEDVVAPFAVPRFSYSMMDGFAVCVAAVAKASAEAPVRVVVVGESRAGESYKGLPIAPFECTRISTGARMPPGADAVVPVEWTEPVTPRGGEDVAVVQVRRAPRVGEFVRREGVDAAAGAALFAAGTFLDSRAWAVAAQFGFSLMPTLDPLRVAIFTSGDELIAPGTPPSGDEVVATSIYTLAQRVEALGFRAEVIGVARDTVEDVGAHLDRALAGADVVIACAGMSVGDYDHVPAVLGARGAKVHFHGVLIKPGKPTLFGEIGGKPVFGLPGNPLSAVCTFELFVRPWLRAVVLGAKVAPAPVARHARLAAEAKLDARRETWYFSRLRWEEGVARVSPPGRQESGNLTLLADADVLARVPSAAMAGAETLAADSLVEILPLGDRSLA